MRCTSVCASSLRRILRCWAFKAANSSMIPYLSLSTTKVDCAFFSFIDISSSIILNYEDLLRTKFEPGIESCLVRLFMTDLDWKESKDS